ncbi:MAG TPA: PilZ domain-containing protein [Candidatus Aminicenantes bacterium]|nr:PilZ domain-containing protein [Candidatus Aminicenantes bacterium]
MSVEPGSVQRRKDRRVKQWNKAILRVGGDSHGSNGASAAEAYTYDLSLGGARLHSSACLAVGTRVSLRLELLRSGETVAIDGLVKWVRPSEADGVYEMGVAFEHSSSSSILSLIRNLHDNSRKDSP